MRLIPMSALLLLVGCTSASRLGTARSLPPGETSHSLILEAWPTGYMFDEHGGRPVKEDLRAPLPRYVSRHAFGPGGDVGVELGPWPGGMVDVKVELVRSRAFDLAVSPAFGGWGIGFLFDGDEEQDEWDEEEDDDSFDQYGTGRLDFVADYNLGRRVSIVSAVGGGWLFHTKGDWQEDGPVLSGSLGLHLRLGRKFALQPSMTVQTVSRDLRPYLGGAIVFHFGAQPEFE